MYAPASSLVTPINPHIAKTLQAIFNWHLKNVVSLSYLGHLFTIFIETLRA